MDLPARVNPPEVGSRSQASRYYTGCHLLPWLENFFPAHTAKEMSDALYLSALITVSIALAAVSSVFITIIVSRKSRCPPCHNPNNEEA